MLVRSSFLLMLVCGCAPLDKDGSVVTLPHDNPVNIEVWKGSDVGLTNILFDLLEKDFAASPDYKLVGAKDLRKFQVYISFVRRSEDFSQAIYELKFMSGFPEAPVLLATREGACPITDLADCSRQGLRYTQEVILQEEPQ